MKSRPHKAACPVMLVAAVAALSLAAAGQPLGASGTSVDPAGRGMVDGYDQAALKQLLADIADHVRLVQQRHQRITQTAVAANTSRCPLRDRMVTPAPASVRKASINDRELCHIAAQGNLPPPAPGSSPGNQFIDHPRV